MSGVPVPVPETLYQIRPPSTLRRASPAGSESVTAVEAPFVAGAFSPQPETRREEQSRLRNETKRMASLPEMGEENLRTTAGWH
jgi:hypothetical protein